MPSIEVVVAAMNQNDLSLAEKMNIRTDLIIANQSSEYGYLYDKRGGHTIKMISTPTRGVGLNRNIGLQHISADIILLADEDIVYLDKYEQIVSEAFEEIPEADVLIFQMRFIKNGEVYDVDQHKTRRLHLWNGLSFGTYQIAIRKKALLRANIHFSHLFGGGCIFSAGEDSLFLIDCFRNGLKVYSYGKLIGNNVRDSSSWFKGFNDKFFYDRGAFAACSFPTMKYLVCTYYSFAYRKVKDINCRDKMRLMSAGAKNYNSLITFEEWEKMSRKNEQKK